MHVYAKYRDRFAQAVSTAAELPLDEVAPQIKDAEPEHGDLTFPTFGLAKRLRKAPPVIAKDLAAKLAVPGLEVAAVGPYVNARLSPLPFTAEVLDAVRAAGTKYGHSDVGRSKTVVMDYSSPNICKPVAYHNVRTTMIGHALSTLYKSQGYRVEGITYLGDWGKQFGLVATGFKEFGDPARRDDVSHLIEVYVKANDRAGKDPAFDEQARAFFRRMEEQEPEAIALWKEMRAASIRELERVYERLGIRFEHVEGESFYQGKMDSVIDEVARTVGTRESEGALVVDMPYADNEPPVMLRKKDGGTVYHTRDLAAAVDRYERFKFDRSLYVVATDQALHFRQLFEVLKRMGRPWADRLTHVNFGRIHGMSTRKGNVVLLTDVLDEAKARALEKVQQNIADGRLETHDAEALAEQIGLGAIIFGDLKNRRITDYTFDWEEVLSFEGHTGPYVQYAHARACKVLAKAVQTVGAYDAGRLSTPEEQAVIRALARFPDSIAQALAHDEPSFVARHLLEVTTAFSRWYTQGNQDRDKRVLVEDAAVRTARLALVDAVRVTLASGLGLLGIAAPSEM